MTDPLWTVFPPPIDKDVAAHSKSDGILPFSPGQVESLHWELCHVKDPRGRNRSIGIGPLLSIFTMAVAAGAKDMKEAHAFAKRLNNAQLKELGCPKAKDAHGDEIWGKYVCPSYNAFYHLVRHKDKAGRHDFDVADYAAHLSKWMTAQHGKLARHLAADGKFVDEVVGLVSVVDAESGDVVAVAPASKKEGLKGRCEYPVLRDTLSGMDLSGAVVSTDALSCQDDTAHTVLGVRTIIRTYREVWQTRKTGKKDTRGRDIRRCVGKPKKTTAQARSDLKLHPAKLVRIMMKGGLQ